MLLVADTSPIISLLLADKFDLLEKLFPNYIVPKAVFDELQNHQEIKRFKNELEGLKLKVKEINVFFPLSGIDIGETEAIILFKETKADFLLIDDKKAREKAELLEISCIGTLGILYLAYKKKLIKTLRPIFELFGQKNRYFSVNYLNYFLRKTNELEL